MAIMERFWDLAVRGLRLLAPLVSRGGGKLARGIRGRARDRGVFGAWARDGRDDRRPLVWFHAPSVGEGLQARAVMRALRAECPDVQMAYSHFSPSAERFAQRIEADVAGYLPWDTLDEIGPVLDALRPQLVAFTKTEVWPGLAAAARQRGIPVVLTAATLPASAGRLRWPARPFLQRTFGSLERVLAISTEDGARFDRLGVPTNRIAVTGDPAMDSVAERVQATDPALPHLIAIGRAAVPTLVAGSTWEPDERVLLPALDRARARMGAADGRCPLRLVIAPHEPDESHLDPLESRLRAHGWNPVRLGGLKRAQDDKSLAAGCAHEAHADAGPVSNDRPTAIVVDRVGVLADLYTLADAAYVGGGFGTDGLHSVLEPAAAGVPVVFGPHHHNARAAAELQRVGGGRAVSDEKNLATALLDWLGDPEAGNRAGRAALRYIEAHQGAARATARELAPLLGCGPEDPSDDRAGPPRASSSTRTNPDLPNGAMPTPMSETTRDRQRPIPEMTPGELQERLGRDQPLVLVDVREPHEAEIADLPEVGQLRIPVDQFQKRADEIDSDAPIVVYCRSGSRSMWAARHLADRGFEQVWNLKGGVLGWRDEVDPSLEAY